MKEGSRSGNVLGRAERSKGPFGCLIVKKKGDGLSNGVSSGKQRALELKERKKRPRLILSESEPDEDSLVSPPLTKVISRDREAAVVVRNATPEIEIDRKRKPGPVIYREDSRIDRNKFLEAGRDRKRSRIDDIGHHKNEKFGKVSLRDGVEERRTEIGRNGVLISKTRVPIGNKRREFETDSSRSISLGNRDHSDFKRSSNLSVDPERESVHMDGQRFDKKKQGNFRPGMLKEKFGVHQGGPIRVQGKNGVLKVMPSNKNKMGPSKKFFTPKKDEENRKGHRSADYLNGKTPLSPALYSENKLHEKAHSVVVTEKKQVNSIKKLSTKHNEVCDQRTQVSEVSLSRESKDVVTCSSKKEDSSKKQKTLTSEPCMPTTRKEREVKRGSGTEKQLLREQIRQMLVNAGWTIDLRPRRNRDYQDSVYINPAGTEYWSITKAYYAFQKNFEDEGREQKKSEDLFTLIPEDVLSKLTRKTRKKVEREMKMQKKADRGSKNVKGTSERKLKNKHVQVKTDSSTSEEDMNSHIMQDGKSLNVRTKGNNVVGQNTDDLAKSNRSTLSKAGCGNGENKKQSGRALLVRSSIKGLNMDGDDFVPYTGKRTVLSWLIDMETVRLSEKVQYMNKKRTRAMLEGWITRDGIHCRCCSKILTISKFELHAGSKLHHPFQNIIVENGVSLYQCQLDAWNMQNKSVRLGFQFIDVDGDDPNDDTCGICGDGGDLICCDGCPSTFHQSCLDIQMLPSGDWLCPNCSCKLCGGVDGSTGQEEDTTLCSCTLCEEKYHRLCRERADPASIDSDNLSISFCGKACEELFQQLQKLLGVKHELEAGFSWTLIQRSNLDSDSSSRGQCQKAECNAKIAVALTVMDECFLPVIDQRSGVNLIHNVAFNIGSNFNRLNYSGFYIAILERGDEIISAASIRIHGTRLAEMPFIGTRHIYRRQGMFRRLLYAIESALCSLSVEKLVIPAISELVHTWTTVFGFKPLEESHRQEVKTLNMLVFPSTDLLQKPLLKHKSNEIYVIESSVVKAVEPDGNNHIMPEMSENTDIDSVEPDTCDPAKGAVCDCEMNDGVCFIETGSRSPGGSTYDTFDTINNPSDASLGTVPDGPSDCSAPDTKFLSHCGMNHDNILEVGTSPICNSSVEPKLQNSRKDDPHEVNVEAAAVKLILHSLDETSVQRTTGNNKDYLKTVSSNGFQPTDTTPVQSNSAWSEQNVHKVESKADLCSVEPSSYAPDKGAVYNHEMNCRVTSIGTGPQDPAGSIYDTSDMINKRLDAAFGSIPDGSSEESAPDTKFLLHHVVDHGIEFDVETKPIVSSPVKPKLQNTAEDDAHQVKVEAAGVELDLHPLAETSVQRRRSTDNDYPNTFSGNCRTGGNHVQSNSDLNEHTVHKVECKSEMVDPVETGASGPSGSAYDTSDMTGDSSDVSFRHMPDALSGVSPLESKCLLLCVNHDTKLDVETKSYTELKLQNSTGDNALEVNVEVASGVQTNTNSNFPNAISGNSFQRTGGDPVERSSCVNEKNIHNLGCTSIEVFHDISDAVYFEANVQSTYEESTKRDVGEVASDLYSSGEGHGHNHLQVATLRSAVGGTCKLENGVTPDKHNPQELGEDLMDCTSVMAGSGLLLTKVQLPKPQDTCTCKWDVELEVGFPCCKDQALSCSNNEAPRQQTPH